MSRQQKNPLRPLLEEERRQLTRLSRGQAIAASSVVCAKALLAVADGDSDTEAARTVGRRSGDAVASLVARLIPRVWRRSCRDTVADVNPTTLQKNADAF